MVQLLLKPGIGRMEAMFKTYADLVLKLYILKHLEAVQRVDVVWDVYHDGS